MPETLATLVVIPTFQEADNIRRVLTEVRSADPSVNVLVVDDSSPDGTADLAAAIGAELGQIEVLRRPGKSGLGAAYRSGFAWGLERGYDVVIEMDADLSHDPKALPHLIAGIEQGADLVVGSRYVPGGAMPDWSTHRALLSRYGNKYATFVLGLGLKDATSGYRAYRASLLRKIELGDVRADGYGFQIEMAYRMGRAGAIVAEVPITFLDRTKGESKMSSRIIIEALALVTFWGFRDRIFRRADDSVQESVKARGYKRLIR